MRISSPLAALAATVLLSLAACGGDDGDPDIGTDTNSDAPAEGEATEETETTTDEPGEGETDADGFTDADHKVHFLNVYGDGTTGMDVDVYWGSFDDDTTDPSAQLATTIAYGEHSDYLSARTNSIFTGADDQPYWNITITKAGTMDVIGGIEGGGGYNGQSLFVFMPGETADGFSYLNTLTEVQTEAEYEGPFSEVGSGQTQINVVGFGSMPEIPALQSGGTCLTTQAMPIDADGYPLEYTGQRKDNRLDLDGGSEVELVKSESHADDNFGQFYTCGKSYGAASTLPDEGLAWVLYGPGGDGQPGIWSVPVDPPSDESNAYGS